MWHAYPSPDAPLSGSTGDILAHIVNLCQVYAIGGLGRDMSTYLEAVEVFDAQQQAWSELKLDAQQSLPFKRAFFAAVARG